ncbi:MAG: endo-1,4-beta-xylanase [Hyphomicrobiaceae bacterium]
MSAITRRRALGLMAAGAACLRTPGMARAQELESIRRVRSLGEIAAQRGILFGTSIDLDTLGLPVQAELYRHHARILTVDNAMKFGMLRPQEGPANFEAADRLVAFAAENKIPLRGHCLAWNDWVPDWVAKLSTERAIYWFDRHIDEVVGRYAGRLHSWDAVNEPLFPLHRIRGGYRSGPWFAAMGKDYIVRALKRASAADPLGKYVINEAGPEWENPWGPVAPYREGLLRIIKDVQDAGVRLDAVGLECHWFPQFTFDAARFTDYLHQLAATGVSIYLTEIDVNDSALRGSQDARDAEVGERFAALITAALKEPKVEAIQTWQLSDNASWLQGEPKLWGPSGRRPRPLPFDKDCQPKAAYHAIAKALSV